MCVYTLVIANNLVRVMVEINELVSGDGTKSTDPTTQTDYPALRLRRFNQLDDLELLNHHEDLNGLALLDQSGPIKTT